MTIELPFFPLNLVAFPGEELNLHIFEPRYKQLINDCLDQNAHFGIPSYVQNKIEYGSEVAITEVSKRYDDGRLDIKTRAVRIFKVVKFHNPWRDHQYAGGQASIIAPTELADPNLNSTILELAEQLFAWLQMEGEVPLRLPSIHVDIVHKIGLTMEEEYFLLRQPSEKKRQHYIIEHLRKLLPALERAEQARERVRLNGHFKHFDPLKF